MRVTFVVTTFKFQALKDEKPDSVVVQAIYLRVQNVIVLLGVPFSTL